MSLPAGTRLGRYEIRSQIGAGGMGEVYLARDSKLNRSIALKVLPAEIAADQQRMKRFIQEAKAASSLNHPNILSIYDVGRTDSSRFIVMEHVEGETLRQRMERGRMSLREVLDVATQIASALAAAHDAGVVHRDIKPENIMLRTDGYIKVLDFGLAKFVGRTGHTEEATLLITKPGLLLGTISYMSPEQARGLKVNAATDVFSLGVVLYEMAAGRRPFEGPTITDVLVSILEREPTPLARHSREAPAELEWIVAKALRKNREERYQTASDFAADLRRLGQRLELERLLASEVSAGAGESRAGTRARAQPSPRLDGGVPGAGQPTPSTSVRKARRTIDSLAVLPLANASRDPHMEYLSDGITESIINSLSQLPQLRVMARSTVFRFKGREIDPRQVAGELGVRAVLLGRVLQLEDRLIIGIELVDAADGSHLWGEQYQRQASDIFEVQEEISREISEKLRLRLSPAQRKRLAKRHTVDAEAYRLYLKGRYHWNLFTKDGPKKAIRYFKLAIEKDAGYALAHAGLADSFYMLSNLHLPPKEAMSKAKAAAMRALEIDNTLAKAHAVLALVRAQYEWDWSGAEKEFKRAIKLNPGDANARHWYGVFLVGQGRFSEAAAELRRAQESDPLSSSIAVTAVWPLYYARRYDEAIERLRRIIESEPDFYPAHSLLASAYEQRGEFAEAIARFEKVIRMDDSPENLELLGHAYAVAGRRSEARQALEDLIARYQQRYFSPYGIGLIYAGLGEIDQAFAWLEKAYQQRDEWLGLLKVNPQVDNLRLDPRFADLERRIGLAP